jgi:hypothetical protein
VHHTPRKPARPVQRHRRGGRLLQRLVGEQPGRDGKWAQLFLRAAPQQGGLDERARPLAEPGARRGDVGDSGGVGQREFGDRRERPSARIRPQIADVVGAEAQPATQDGLTPVTITL